MTTIIFRDDIGIYTGKGSKLSSGEIDTNFYELLVSVLALQDGGAFACESIDFTGNSITFNWSDDTSSGPFALPVATFQAKGVWQNDQSLLRLDVVTVPGVGTYLVQIDHTTPPAPAEFDPAADDGATDPELLYLPISDAVDLTGYMLFRGAFVGGTQYDAGDVVVDPTYGLFSVNALTSASSLADEDYTQIAGPPFAPFEELTATTKTLSIADVGKVFRCPNGCDVTFPDDVDFPVSAEISFRQTGTDPVNFLEGGTGVQINPQREGFDTSTPYQGALITAKFVSSTEIDLIGPYGEELT
jgi:hypothetical protein